MENKWQKWYIFWNREYEGEFPDFLGQKNLFIFPDFQKQYLCFMSLKLKYIITKKNGKWTRCNLIWN